jgi:hypothetical protein
MVNRETGITINTATPKDWKNGQDLYEVQKEHFLTYWKNILSSKEEKVRQVVKYNFFYTVHLWPPAYQQKW